MIRLLTLILLISVSSYGQTKPPIASKPGKLSFSDDWKTLQGEDYSIIYPSSWTLEQFEQVSDQPELAYLKFILYAPLSDGDIFRKNVTLLTQDIRGIAFDFNEYITMNEAQIKAQATTSTFIESKRIKGGKNDYHRMTYLTEGFMGSNRIEQFYFMIGTKAFTFTFASGQTKFQKTRKIALKIVESFRANK